MTNRPSLGVYQQGYIVILCTVFVLYMCQSTRLCKSTWGHCSIYNRRLPAGFSYRRLYLQLDEGSLTFNANPQEVTHTLPSKLSSLQDAHCLSASVYSLWTHVCVTCHYKTMSLMQCHNLSHYSVCLGVCGSLTWLRPTLRIYMVLCPCVCVCVCEGYQLFHV